MSFRESAPPKWFDDTQSAPSEGAIGAGSKKRISSKKDSLRMKALQVAAESRVSKSREGF
eukprot:1179758-Prorocentrum_minimum.AAC.4